MNGGGRALNDDMVPTDVGSLLRRKKIGGSLWNHVAFGDTQAIDVVGGEVLRLEAIQPLGSKEGGERIQGPHCYAFYSGQEDFAEMMEAEPASFFLTDYLARHFETLILKGMGIDKHPELEEMMFGNYRRLVYLAQEDNPELRAKAEAAAARLGLEYEHRKTGYGELASFVAAAGQR